MGIVASTRAWGRAALRRSRGERGRLVGVSGYMHSGKSTTADMLVEKGFVRVPLAKPLKDMLVTLGLTEAQVRGDEKNIPDHEILNGVTPRLAMQTLGTEWGRQLIDSNIWVNAWWSQAKALLKRGYDVVCDDVRFSNEYDFLQPRAAAMVMVKRPGCEAGEHASEKLGFTPANTIYNDTTLKALQHAVDNFERELSGCDK